MPIKRSVSKPKSPLPLQAFLTFVVQHLDAPLAPDEEIRLFALDSAAGAYCVGQHITPPVLSDSGYRTPGMKLTYEKESIYKYPGALSCDPQIPEGETERYGICLDPHEDWLLWLRAVATSLPEPKAHKSLPQRAPRAAHIEALEDALIEHLKAARDFAHEQKNHGSVPRLLPRPSQTWLAKRLGINKSTVHHCLNDPKARELKALWNAASDLNQIMTFKTPPGRRTSH